MQYPLTASGVNLYNGKFTNGDPLNNIPRSIDRAEDMNRVYDEIIAALVAFGLTPSEADNSQLAQLFQKVIGSNLGVLVVTGNVTLTAADAGKLIVGGSASPFTVTLPLTSTVRDGGKFECVNMNAGAMTIQRQGSTDIINTSSTRTSEVLGTGDSLVVHAKPSLNMWYASSGTNQFTYANKFSVSRNSNGWQKLPSDLIVQWGAFTSSGTVGNSVAVNFNIAFPNACFRVLLTPTNNSTTAANAWHNNDQTTSGFGGRCNIANNTVHYFAIGY